jgi:uncharacterized protein
LSGEPTGHDWFHVERVWKTALKLHEQEGGDKELIELSSLLHDLGDYKFYGLSEIKGNLVLRGMMEVMEIESVLQEKIMKIISESQYKGDETKTPSTIEGKIIQDADWLDALGAIGVARTLATGGNIGRMIYDPNIKPRQRLSRRDYQMKKTESTSVNYFYEKTLKLPDMMNTETGKKKAQKRIKFVKFFLEEFLEEWE